MEAEQILRLYGALWAAVLGAAVGSFLDCTAVRGELPRGRSRCDSCGHPLGPAELVPIFSYLVFRGRCRHCGSAIPVRCLWAEIAGAFSFAALWLHLGPGLELLMHLILASLLLWLSLTDWISRTIPDRLLLAAAANRFLFLWLRQEPLKEAVPDMVIGALSVSLPLLLLSLGMDRLVGQESMGGGDIKLLFVLGLYFSWMDMLLLLLVACVMAILWAVISGQGKAGRQIPFGPFLSAAWLAVVLWGEPLITWYRGLLG